MPLSGSPARDCQNSLPLAGIYGEVAELLGKVHWLVRRWFPEREIVLVGDGGFAATSLGHTCRRLRVRFISRLLLTAQLYDPVPPQPKGKPGVKPKKGSRQPQLTEAG